MRHYWVDPQNTARIEGAYTVGDAVRIDDDLITANLRGPAPALNLYLAIEDNTAAPTPYHRVAVATAFEGAVGDDAARVREARTFDRIPADELLAARLAELAAQVEAVDAQGLTVSALSAGARAVRTDARPVRQYQNLRLTKSTIPDATAVTMKDLADRWFACTKGDAEEILTAIALLHEAPITANAEAHDDELNRLHGLTVAHPPDSPEYASGWDALAAYDLTTGWPPAPSPLAGRTRHAARGWRWLNGSA